MPGCPIRLQVAARRARGECLAKSGEALGVRSCAGAAGEGGKEGGGEGGERVTRRPPPPTRGKLPAPLPACCRRRPAAARTAGKLPQHSGRQAGSGPGHPLPPRPETGSACDRYRRPRRLSWAGGALEAATAGWGKPTPRSSRPSLPPTPGRCQELPPGSWRGGMLPTRGAQARPPHPRGSPCLPTRAARELKTRAGGGRRRVPPRDAGHNRGTQCHVSRPGPRRGY